MDIRSFPVQLDALPPPGILRTSARSTWAARSFDRAIDMAVTGAGMVIIVGAVKGFAPGFYA